MSSVEDIKAKLSKFLLGDNQQTLLFEKLEKFAKACKKKNKDDIITYYMKMKTYFYNYQFRKEIKNEKDLDAIKAYFGKFEDKINTKNINLN